MRAGLVVVVVVGMSWWCPVSAQGLPSWFGRPDLTPHRIAGQLRDGAGPVAGIVHLRIDVPDPTVWAGVDLEVGGDGRFDFGLLRPGRYHVFATATGKTSRVVGVDTRAGAAEALTVYIYPCTIATSVVLREGRQPVANALVDIAGAVVAVTDASGRFGVCENHEQLEPTVRASGYTPGKLVAWQEGEHFTIEVRIAPSIRLRGRVIDARGRPVAGVAVQPVTINQHRITHCDSGDWPTAALATTDADGQFVLTGISRSKAQYYFRVIDRDLVFEDRNATVTGDAGDDVIVHMIDAIPDDTQSWPPKIDTAVSGYVRHHGVPLPDALVTVFPTRAEYAPRVSTRTKPDGSFEIEADRGPNSLTIEHATGLVAKRLVTLDDQQQLSGLVVDVGTPATITGVVVDGDGKPVDEGHVSAHGLDTATERFDSTRRGGYFTIEAESGHAYVVAAYDGRRTVERTIWLGPEGASGVRIVLDREDAPSIDEPEDEFEPSGSPLVILIALALAVRVLERTQVLA